MAYVINIPNCFEPFTSDLYEVENGSTILDWLNKSCDSWSEGQFDYPTIIQINGKCIAQKEYGFHKLKEGDIATCSVLVGEAFTIVLTVVSLLVSVASFIFAPQPPQIGQVQNPDSVFTLSGQNNKNKLGQAIPSVFGQVRNWPDLAALSYNQYVDNKQYQFSLYSLGAGFSEIEQAKFANTPVEDFESVEIELVKPNESVTLFRDSVATSADVGNIQLYGTDEPEYVGFSGPFTINEVGTEIDKIDIDIVMPKGLVRIYNGVLYPLTITAKWQYRQIDDLGDPVSSNTDPAKFFVETVTQTRTIISQYRTAITYTEWETESNTSVELNHANADGYQTVVYSFDNPSFFTPTEYRSDRRVITTYRITGIDGWYDVPTFSKTLATTTPQRFTLEIPVSLGRYEIRGRRTNTKVDDVQYNDDLIWELVRGFYPSVKGYGNVTLVAVKALATSNLNDNNRSAFNVLQKRLLPIYDETEGEFGEYTFTRNPVDALFEIFTSEYGGNLPKEYFDFDTLLALRQEFEDESITFDYIFEAKSALWDAAKLALSVGRAVPVPSGSIITAIRDTQEDVPSAIFTPDTMLKGSFKWEMNFFKDNDNDGLEIEFIDETDFKPRTILCLVEDDEGINPSKVRIKGITNADKAYREGLHIRAKQVYQKEFFSFATGLEGHIPNINSVISVSHDLIKYGQSGHIESVTGLRTLQLDKEVTFTNGGVHLLSFRDKNGNQAGPYLIESQVGSSDLIVTTTDITEDVSRTANQQPIIFIFGEQTEDSLKGRVLDIDTSNPDQITIQCVNNDIRVFANDAVNAPAINAVQVRENDPLPVVTGLTVETLNGSSNFVRVAWRASTSAKRYVIEYSYDDVIYTIADEIVNNSYILEVNQNSIYIRVAGINVGVGPYANFYGYVGEVTTVPDTVQNLSLQVPFTGNSATLQWSNEPTSTSYTVKIKRNSNSALLRSVEVYQNIFEYRSTEALSDFAGTAERTLDIEVFGENAEGQSITAATLEITNPIPVLPTGIGATITSLGGDLYEIVVSWDLSSNNDVKEYIVYGNDIDASYNVLSRSLNNSYSFTISRNSPFSYFVKVGICDLWGPDIILSTSIELTG